MLNSHGASGCYLPETPEPKVIGYCAECDDEITEQKRHYVHDENLLCGRSCVVGYAIENLEVEEVGGF